ncbi:hypothetical protein [Asticcacaulis machinosus]|uniref:Uncharacterized protein n=1 Tax=Asticcacaulis machinosus TaxID=2984211 RepID=A0ABT5HII5_9CAUL|nr:hypothetical protein [Asticcacaulis machinosus]MDC7676052.1 hypothetical protein [Asticcacaulis machinosus]
MDKRAFHITGTIYIVIAMLLGGVIGFLKASGHQLPSLGTPLLWGMIALLIVLAMAVSILWWRASDEAVREAHKWAWFWGGSCGLMVVMPVYFLSVATGGEFGESLMAYFNAHGSAFEFGIMTGLIPPIVGYVIAWGIWWLRHR